MQLSRISHLPTPATAARATPSLTAPRPAFLEVVVQQPLFSSLLLSCIPGEGPGSWLMHFPYVVLHGIFGKF